MDNKEEEKLCTCTHTKMIHGLFEKVENYQPIPIHEENGKCGFDGCDCLHFVEKTGV